MTQILLSFVIFLVVFAAMAVGYLFQRKSIAGSCGGLGSIGIEKACDCPEPCDKRKARDELKQKRQAVIEQNRII